MEFKVESTQRNSQGNFILIKDLKEPHQKTGTAVAFYELYNTTAK